MRVRHHRTFGPPLSRFVEASFGRHACVPAFDGLPVHAIRVAPPWRVARRPHTPSRAHPVGVHEQRALSATQDLARHLTAAVGCEDEADIWCTHVVFGNEGPVEAVLGLAITAVQHPRPSLIGHDDRARADSLEQPTRNRLRDRRSAVE